MKSIWKATAVLLSVVTYSAASARADAHVRVLNGVTGVQKVDVYIDGEKKLNDVQFGGVTKYLKTFGGTHSIRIATNNPSRTLVNTTKTLRDGDYFTVSVYGASVRPRLQTHNDSIGIAPRHKAQVNFFNLATGGPTFDVRATLKPTGEMARIVRGVRFGQVKVGNTWGVQQSLRLLNGSRSLKTIDSFKPKDGYHYSVYAIGQVERNYRVILVEAG